jgi:hypothetical protein
MYNFILSFCIVGIEGDGERWRSLVIEGAWGSFQILLSRSWRHKDWWCENKEAYYREPMWFQKPTWCLSDKSLWALVKGIFMPQNWKVTNSSSIICMWYKTFNYIQEYNYFIHLYLGRGIKMWFLTYGVWWCCQVWIWIFGNETWWFFNIRKGFPMKLSGFHFLNPTMMIVSHLCRRWMSLVPFEKGEMPFLGI